MKPISFNAEMVKAILEGVKTQTRRPIKTKEKIMSYEGSMDCIIFKKEFKDHYLFLTKNDELSIEPKYKIGDVCFIKKPKIFLKITDVRVGKLQDISTEDIGKEGFMMQSEDHVGWFINLWNSIYKKQGIGWDKNPYVWVYEFERIPK